MKIQSGRRLYSNKSTVPVHSGCKSNGLALTHALRRLRQVRVALLFSLPLVEGLIRALFKSGPLLCIGF